MQRGLRIANLVIAFIATTAPLAHVLELPSKLTLSGPLWLAVQQSLYRGWGSVFGPVEIAAFASSLWLYFAMPRTHSARGAYLIATVCYAVMIACFFVFNDPVNAALNGWTAATLPGNWSSYRAKWEIGHAITAVFSVIAFVTLVRTGPAEADVGRFTRS